MTISAEYVPGIGWMWVDAHGRHGSFETEKQAIAAGRAAWGL